MRNLNEIYKNDELFYYCNSCGEINIPNTDVFSYHDVDELPIKERNLYENYWSDAYGFQMYVVNYNGNAAMALNFLFCETYLSDILNKDKINDTDMQMLYNAISDYAKILEKDKIVAFCDIAVGDYTDPDGHELLVIIPYERRTEIKNIAEALENVVSNGVESLI